MSKFEENAPSEWVQAYIEGGQPFTDLDFEPCEESLSADGKFDHLKWKRISEIMKDP